MTTHDEIAVQFALLYKAGIKTFPTMANSLTRVVDGISEVHASWTGPVTRAGSPPALTDTLAITQECHRLLRRAALSYQDASFAMLAMARDFEATDDRAADAARVVKEKIGVDTPPTMRAPAPLDGGA